MDSEFATRGAPRNDGSKQQQGRPPMSNDMVLQKLEGGLLTITMNRPERKNALNPDMVRGLVEAARRAADDPEVRAVLFKGAGGSFCVGGDVKSMAEGRAPLPFEQKLANLRRGMEVSRILHQMPKTVVAQLDGAPAGAGLSMALSCDLRIASDLQDHDGVRQSRLLGRLWRHLFPDPAARQRARARALSNVAGAHRQGSARYRHGHQGRARCRDRCGHSRACAVAGAGSIDRAR